MSHWFLIKIKFFKEKEGGKIEKITEDYLFDALTYGEVEQRVLSELAENMRCEFNLLNIAKMPLHEVFYFEEGEHWFKCKVSFVELDEEKGKETKVQQNMLIFAYTVADAYEKLQKALQDSGFQFFEITLIQTTKICDVFAYHTLEPPTQKVANDVQSTEGNNDLREKIFANAFDTPPFEQAEKELENEYFA